MSHQASRSDHRHRSDGIGLDSVSHGYGRTSVLEDVTVSVSPGETLAIIGPSGTGKTTLLRLLAMFERPDSGVVRLDGDEVWSRSESERLAYRRHVGMVFQQPNLFGASVRRNVSYGVHIRRDWSDRLRAWATRLTREPPEAAVTDALDVVGMGGAANQDASSLSGGEAQRVAFARAIAYDPTYLLLDEPSSDLDPRNTAMIEAAMDAARARGLGLAVATHDMHQARRVADRVAVMIDGEIIAIGPTETIFEDPADRRVQKFIRGELVY